MIFSHLSTSMYHSFELFQWSFFIHMFLYIDHNFKVISMIISRFTVPTFNSCTKWMGSPGIINNHMPDCYPIFLGIDVWMTLQMNVVLIRKLHVSLMCLDYFLGILAWLFIQPGICRRSIDWCRN